MRPTRLPGFTDSRAVTQHHQGQHGVTRRTLEAIRQQAHQVLQLHVTQPRRLGQDPRRGEVDELHFRHRVDRDQVQLAGLTESHREQPVQLLHIGQR